MKKVITVVDGYPPNYDEVKRVLNPSESTVLTYGNTAYVRGGRLPNHLIAHESIHALQQEDPVTWWEKYLRDPAFRLSQELEAYKAQYRYFCEHNRARGIQFKFLHRIASDLSGELYGNIITYAEATKQIKS